MCFRSLHNVHKVGRYVFVQDNTILECDSNFRGFIKGIN